VAETPHSRPAPPAQTAPPRPGAPADEDLGSGQSRLDAGDVAGAGAIFARMVAATPADNLTLQVLIACETENILKARNATRPDGPLFVVPFRLQGRSCWRVCWGRYGDRDAAHAAAAAMPPYFTTAGLTPVVVSFGRLRPPG
jgi:septal ring-binding cell division protein DamX